MQREASGLPISAMKVHFATYAPPDAEPSGAPTACGAESDGGRMDDATPVCDVLVVEDECDLREPLVERLAGEGFQVIGARNGADALQYATARVVVTDLSMPGGDGLDLVQALREAGHSPGVVLMSGRREIHEIGREQGADASFQKPFDLVEFLRTITRLVEASIKKRVA